MNDTNINPSILFYNKYEGNIIKTRESLFHELNNVSSDFGNEARKILEAKLKSNSNIPLLGELFPWIINDLVNADPKTTHKVSVGWLAIYLYTLFLDEHVDNPKQLDPTKFMAGSLLASTGLLKISRFTNNTPFEGYIDKAFSHSAKNQHLDILFQKENADLHFKENYSEGKNYIVLACAGALAAQNSNYAEFIIQFTKKLLLTLQYLDDICDYEEDFATQNFTVLLSDTFQNNKEFIHSFKSYSNRELLSELIGSGALQRVVKKVISLLNQSVLLIQRNNLPNNKASVEFFYTLLLHCQSLNSYLNKNQMHFEYLPIEEKSVILDKVEKHITLIAQSS